MIAGLAGRAYFALCLALGRLLRAGRYARARPVERDGLPRVRKERLPHAPLLIRLGNPLYRILGTGVRVLPRRAWAARERLLYRELYDAAIGIEAGGALLLPRLVGETLASLLDDPALAASARGRAIALAVGALAALHRRGFTHGDAMAENVLIDRAAGVARWIDFETRHDPRRPPGWRRADDLRALLATCLIRTAPGDFPATIGLILDHYPDPAIARPLAASFATVWRRPLVVHLAQAGLSFAAHRAIARSLRARGGG